MKRWFRRRPAAHRGEHAWLRDRLRKPDERIRLRDVQIRELREQNGALTADNAQLRVALAAAVMAAGLERYRQDGAERARRIAEEPTVRARAMGRTRRDAPTERWSR